MIDTLACDHFLNRNYDTRYDNANYLVTPRIDNNLCRQSVLYVGPRIFNGIPYDIRVNSPTLTKTKNIHSIAIGGFLEWNYYCFFIWNNYSKFIYMLLMCVFVGLSICVNFSTKVDVPNTVECSFNEVTDAFQMHAI